MAAPISPTLLRMAVSEKSGVTAGPGSLVRIPLVSVRLE
jgi:hypothetical protein